MKKFVVFAVFCVLGLLTIGVMTKKFGGNGRPVVEQELGGPEVRETVGFLKGPEGYRIAYFAKDLDGVRDLEISPGGKLVASLTGRGEVVALPEKKILLSGLSRPHGLVFYKNWLLVAEETKVTRYFWDEERLEVRLDKKILDLPKGGNHFTRDLVFNSKSELFISLGSTCNVCAEKHPWLAAVIVTDENGNEPRVFAKGLRNSVFLTINPSTDEVWAGDMGRDLIGDDIPQEEINIIREGKHYGWPYCYGSRAHDDNFDPMETSFCQETEPPIYGYQAHAAPLGLTFWQGDLLIAYHGSWNRSAPVGYKVVRFKVEGNRITDEEDFITGFLEGSGVLGRPVDIVAGDNALYLSDDKAGAVYMVTKV